MSAGAADQTVNRRAPRLPRAERGRQLLGEALAIVREEGADRLTLGRLATRAKVSKPVVYDHFATRSRLLIDLYRWIDTERVRAFREALDASKPARNETLRALAEAYIVCASDLSDDFHVVGAALAGSEEKAIVFQELLDNVVDMFVEVLRPFGPRRAAELRALCIAMVGAGEALSAAVVRQALSAATAADTLHRVLDATLIADR